MRQDSPASRPPPEPRADRPSDPPAPTGPDPLRGCGPAIGFGAALLLVASCAMVYEPEIRHGLSRMRAVIDDAADTVEAATRLRHAVDAPSAGGVVAA